MSFELEALEKRLGLSFSTLLFLPLGSDSLTIDDASRLFLLLEVLAGEGSLFGGGVTVWGASSDGMSAFVSSRLIVVVTCNCGLLFFSTISIFGGEEATFGGEEGAHSLEGECAAGKVA